MDDCPSHGDDVLSFVIGNVLGAFQAWPGAPRWLMLLMPPLLAMSAVPFFLLGLDPRLCRRLQLAIAAALRRLHAGSDSAMESFIRPGRCFDTPFCRRLAIILGSLGGWALGMRAMMVTTQGEDYVTFAEAKGLKDGTLFVHYGIRNAMLPQATALALIARSTVSGAVLVEIVFGYPGIGTLLFQGIQGLRLFPGAGNCIHRDRRASASRRSSSILIYPLLDPRIVSRKRMT